MSNLGLPVISGTSAINGLSDRVLTDGLGHLEVVISGSSAVSVIDASDGLVGQPAPLYASQTGVVDGNVNLVAAQKAYALNATNQVSVGTGATLIIAANASRAGVLVTNPSSSVSVYVGGSGVTTGNGQILSPSQSISIPTVSAVYGIVASSTQTVSYIELV